jgi:peptide/nickel transport system substrate-binding protein
MVQRRRATGDGVVRTTAMRVTARRATAMLGVLAVGLAGAAAGCGDGEAHRDDAHRRGGVLKISGSSPPDHFDTAVAYSAEARGFSRNFARTLFGNRASNTFAETIPVVPDMAVELPTRANGGVSADGRTYTIKVRRGVRWNTRTPREVTAGDFVRGIKRQCNPAAPAGVPYYRSLIVGMEAFCTAYAKVAPQDPAAMAAYQDTHDIAGLSARDDHTLTVRLIRPASDFLNVMGMSFAAAAPKEYDRYIPDSAEFRQHTISDGPYQLTAVDDRRLVLGRNPTWAQATDPLRKQYVDRIEITLGQDSPDAVQQQIEQGTADLSWDNPVPTAAIQRLIRAKDPRFKIYENPNLSPFLVFNLQSPNNGRALAKKEVRQAIAYAIDKSAIVKIYGGRLIARVVNGSIPPETVGYQAFNPYQVKGDVGDPARCRRLLAQAGYANGLTLRFPFRTNGNHAKTAQSIQANLQACGITTRLTSDTGTSFYKRMLANPADAKTGAWDIAAPGWTPDWYGNNGRSMLQPLFDGRLYGPGSPDFGGYNNPVVNTLMDRAMAARSKTEAGRLWHQVDRRIMQDAPIVPLVTVRLATYRSERVRNALFMPTTQMFDLSQIWLAS